MIAVMSLAWSLLSSQPLSELVPFVGAGFVIWTYLSQAITDCTHDLCLAWVLLSQSKNEFFYLNLFRHLQKYHCLCA
jgi:ABC-type polysaccharide/polyol phosphate export permease